MKAQSLITNWGKHPYSPLYGKRIVPKPIRRYLSRFVAILAAIVLLIAYFQNTIPASLAMQGLGGVAFLYWICQPLPIRGAKIDRNH